ncbi:MAG: molecular chaperone DnaJ, partial [Alphaproteobacteria bacterium]|nr:molecular chaperone DnaJ [Alphaproteobacteria bacterium]
AMIEMELDHTSGGIEGSVLAGMFEGKRLSDLSREQCDSLYRACLASDPDGARLLETYLDRRFPGWRPAGDMGADAGASQRAGRSAAAMSEDEAYEILGLQKGATREEVARAHRALMKKLHPDHGGSTNLAARVNEAKEVLLRRTH